MNEDGTNKKGARSTQAGGFQSDSARAPEDFLEVLCVGFAKDNEHFVSIDARGNVLTWGIREERIHKSAFYLKSVFPDSSNKIKSLFDDGENPFDDNHNKIKLSYDGNMIACAPGNNKLLIWDLSSGISGTYEWPNKRDGCVSCIAWSPNSKLLAFGIKESGKEEKKPALLLLWDISKKGTVGQELELTEDANCILFSNKMGFLVSTSANDSVIIWKPKNSNSSLMQKLEGHKLYGHDEGPVNSISVSPDDIFVASAAADRTIRVWNVNTLQQVWALQNVKELKESVSCIAWSRDDKFLVSCSSMGDTVLLWTEKVGEYFPLSVIQVRIFVHYQNVANPLPQTMPYALKIYVETTHM
jgi:WD40 repeat protein